MKRTERSMHAVEPCDDDGTAPDIVFALGFTHWSGAAARNFLFSEDRLAHALLGHTRVRRVLVCDPFRSAPRKLARRIVGPRDALFPVSSRATHHGPLRVRRDDPTRMVSLKRAYAQYERSIRRAARRDGLERPAVVTTNPLLAGFGEFSWAECVTYYAFDDWAAYEPHRHWWPAYTEAFSQMRDRERRVVAVSAAIIDRIMPTGAHAVVPNGIDADEWQDLPPSPPQWFTERPSPRLLYVGALQSRVDVEQLRDLALALPEGSITLVGPLIEPAHFARLFDIANVSIHSDASREEIRGLMAHAHVGLIPHLRSGLTEAMSPLKLYEYLASGLPVAAVDLKPIAGVSDRVALVPPGGKLLGAVQHAISLGRQAEPDRLSFVDENSWERRFDLLLDVALASSGRRPVAPVTTTPAAA